ncbi:uncharacterized protein LOC117650047 [Thrips palmi]|uniref:Uncharacterized protein LOC117650047 n=1 Tax=Thrips palmi TaxID=161013 RepID=A0A6P8ZVN4_THRPL|nr:uncharacterized protein LOC117650047 [Thrips palmi]
MLRRLFNVRNSPCDSSHTACPKVLDGVRQLSEGVSRSPTLLAVCRALEAGVASRGAAASEKAAPRAATQGYLCYSNAWSEYLGSGIVPGDITLMAKGYEQVMDLTLDAAGADRLLALVEEGSRQRCCCRAFTALLAVATFLAAIVIVSLALSRGQRVFGAL